MIISSGNYSAFSDPLSLAFYIGIVTWNVVILCLWVHQGIISMHIYLDALYEVYLKDREEQIEKYCQSKYPALS